MPTATHHLYFASTTLPCMRQTGRRQRPACIRMEKRETRCETLTDFASFRCGSLVRFRAGDRQISQPTRLVDALLVDAGKEIETLGLRTRIVLRRRLGRLVFTKSAEDLTPLGGVAPRGG